MSKSFDLTKFKDNVSTRNQYQRQLRRLADAGKSVECIEHAVRESLKNLSGKGRKSFVIYGEPQSGKTEMMICLTAKLLDEERPLIIHLLNDSVDLLGQNLGRFKASGLAPSAQNFSEVLDPSINLAKGQHVIFCKKNAKDLQKLSNKIGALKDVIIIDDEADYASPNGKVNRADKTRINELISDILGDSGDYIGVTATPARLDLNNTFDNDSGLWVSFPPHSHYTGQDVFFPFDDEDAENASKFRLTLLKEKGDDPKFARAALFSFMVNVAYLNIFNNKTETNYSMLIHTSGNKVDHKADWDAVQEALSALTDRGSAKFGRYVRDIWTTAHDRYSDVDPDTVTTYIVDNASRNAVILLNSDSDFRQNGLSATNPSSLFTVVIGGNIVSRGVTFDNLLSMFFTRDVKHKIQQDTYIQRARMFGARGKYLKFFELTIPESLYKDWNRCFVFHRLSLASIKAGKGSPVWLSDSRIAAVASASIDKSTVDIDRGEMAFALFRFDPKMDALVGSKISTRKKLEELALMIGDDGFPEYLRRFIVRMSRNIENDVSIQKSAAVYPRMNDKEKAAISRTKGMMGASQTSGDKSKHSLKIFTNDDGMGRMYYKYSGSIEFAKNMK
ncbi:DNA helicase (plasmid) [Azospirillum argentinense]|uniref:DNA helicase n=1 Tax=Azospirillum argentinense TaxID=2970906 RepID=A0A2K1FUQ5_9PROT|nr:Z1 domain-containing protein [Azospirillum argentinense]PNQ96228.1 DNA helicase [Azospirillum argentinense]